MWDYKCHYKKGKFGARDTGRTIFEYQSTGPGVQLQEMPKTSSKQPEASRQARNRFSFTAIGRIQIF